VAISRNGLLALKEGALHTGTVGYISRDQRSIHAAYRYPARYSPVLARAAIELFSQEDDVVLDPFCGGGTTGIEANLCGRSSFNSDLSPLASFITAAKGRFFTDKDYEAVSDWVNSCVTPRISDLRVIARKNPIPDQHLGGLRSSEFSSVREALSSWVVLLDDLECGRDLARLCLLRLGQRMIDLRRDAPGLDELREGLRQTVDQNVNAALFHRRAVTQRWQGRLRNRGFTTELAAAQGLPKLPALQRRPPSLAVFSPPYPGVHAIYPRWQVRGRKETTIPFWLAGVKGDASEVTYTMGGRGTGYINEFVESFANAMRSVSQVLQPGSHVVQVLGFREPKTQLPRLLDVMKDCGFRERTFTTIATNGDGRLWRTVPSQKWYSAVRNEKTPGSSEVVLIHRLPD